MSSPLRTTMNSISRNGRITIFVVLSLFIIGALGFLKTWSYYGQSLHGWDAQFYYAQARAIGFEGSFDLTKSIESSPSQAPFLPNETGYLTALPRHEGKVINKYPIGLSLLEIPSMRLGEWINSIWHSGHQKEIAGYSSGAIFTVGLGLLFLTVLGLTLLYRLLRDTYGIWPAYAGIMTAWLGTSLFYYTSIFPYMPHGIAFALVVLILWQVESLREHESPGLWHFTGLAFSMGYLFLVRPQQILLLPLVLPFLIAPLRRSQRPFLCLVTSAITMGILAAIQALLNYSQVGSWTLNAYASNNESFDWTHPDWKMVLLHPARGLFWMNPVVILAVPCVLLCRPARACEKIMLGHALVQTYLIACWSSPEQGDSFGPRMLSECAPLIAMGIAQLLSTGKSRIRYIWMIAMLSCIAWTNYLLLLYIRGDLLITTTYSEILGRVWRNHL